MRKVFVLLSIAALSMGASFAAINDNATSDIDLLRNQGYSEGILNVIDTAKSHDGNGNNPRYYTTRGKNALGRGYTSLKTYIDPVQDDGLFGEHQINFSNSWTWGRNRYSSRYRKANNVENL